MDLFDAASENNTETVSIFSMVFRIRVDSLHFRLPDPFQGTGSGPLKA